MYGERPCRCTLVSDEHCFRRRLVYLRTPREQMRRLSRLGIPPFAPPSTRSALEAQPDGTYCCCSLQALREPIMQACAGCTIGRCLLYVCEPLLIVGSGRLTGDCRQPALAVDRVPMIRSALTRYFAPAAQSPRNARGYRGTTR